MPSSTRAQVAAAYAQDCATDTLNPGYAALSGEMCWDAVVRCARDSGAITATQAQQARVTSRTSFTQFVSSADPLVPDAAAMRAVPQGAFLAFIRGSGAGERLFHAMIATGHGLAAGTKNSCIGPGAAVGWEILNLATLRWLPGRQAFNAATDDSGEIAIQIRYRAL